MVAALYNRMARPIYQATCQILINRDPPKVLPNSKPIEMVQGGWGVDYYHTHYQLLRGRRLAEDAVERMGLQTNAEFKMGPLIPPWERFARRILGRPVPRWTAAECPFRR
jgi:uncharacterized protein involved in exopolysaccharide biosynthesis